MSAMEAGRELDALVAERIMGKKVVWAKVLDVYKPGEDGSLENMVPEFREFPFEDMGDGVILYWTAEQGTPTVFAPEVIPSYSRDMGAAWEVVEKLRERGHSVSVTLYWSGESWAQVIDNVECVANATGATAPLAICRAALAAVGHHED